MAVVDSIFGHARAAPDSLALVHNGQAWTYRAFAGAIERARRAFAGQAIGGGRVAILCLDGPLDGWIAGLALRSLGVTTVHARSAEDIERLALNAACAVTTAGGAWPELEAAAARADAPLVLAPDDLCANAEPAGEVEPLPSTPPPMPPGGHILLTSGTTGAYKKVLIDTADEARNTPRRFAMLGLTPTSVIDVFDFGGWTAIGYQWPVCAWTLGATAVLQQAPDRYRSLATPGLTHVLVQPQLLAELLAAPADMAPRNDAMALFVGAGVLPLAQWRAARERLTHDVRNMVGSTETGTIAVTRIETPEDLAWHQLCDGAGVEVVDEADRPLPPGQAGVVRVRANGVDAYLGDPEASAAFFRHGCFYPGDLGVLREDGRLSLQGRVTDVINVGGDKIATTPIETALQDRLGAEAVCVFSVPGQDGEAVHVAIQTARPVGAAELKAALLAALPAVPQARVHAVKAFPRNHLGKIERAALKAQLLGEDTPGGGM